MIGSRRRKTGPPGPRGPRDRRGATLILVALLLVVLIGMVGVVIDFSRFYAYRIQMETTADAVALAAVQEVGRKSPATAPDTALHYVPLNVVDGGPALVPRDSVQPGVWNFTTQAFTAAANFTDPGVNAALVSVNHTASYTFGRVWRTADQNLSARAIAALGYVSTTSCLKPWAVSYQSLLDQIYPPAGSQPLTYDLTQADINSLNLLGPGDAISLLVSDTITTPHPGVMAPAQVSAPWNNRFSYRNAITGCSNMQIGPGTTLNTFGDSARASTQTPGNLNTFCAANGGVTGGPAIYSCTGPAMVKVAAWDNATGSSLTARYRVKYVGAFAITGYTTTGGARPITHIQGYFTSMAGLGTVGSTPAPIVEGLLVQ